MSFSGVSGGGGASARRLLLLTKRMRTSALLNREQQTRLSGVETENVVQGVKIENGEQVNTAQQTLLGSYATDLEELKQSDTVVNQTLADHEADIAELRDTVSQVLTFEQADTRYLQLTDAALSYATPQQLSAVEQSASEYTDSSISGAQISLTAYVDTEITASVQDLTQNTNSAIQTASAQTIIQADTNSSLYTNTQIASLATYTDTEILAARTDVLAYVNSQLANVQTDASAVEARVSVIEGDMNTVEAELVTINANIASIQTAVATLQSQIWAARTIFNTPAFTVATTPNSGDYLPNFVVGTNLFGLATSLEHVGMDVEGDIRVYIFLLTIPDQGFDVVPLITHIPDGTGYTKSPVRTIGRSNATPIKYVWLQLQGLGITYISKREITADNRTSFLIAVAKHDDVFGPSEVVINWIKKTL